MEGGTMVRQAANLGLERKAALALVWEDLVNPVRAIRGYQEIILEECRRLGLDQLLPSLEKVLIAANALGAQIEELHHAVPKPAAGAESDLVGEEARLRHDLRTPLNAIIGYTEMVVEDIEDIPLAKGLRADLAKLLGEAHQLLARVDAIVDLIGPRDGSPALVEGNGQPMIEGLLHTLRPSANSLVAGEVGRILVVDDNRSNLDLLTRRLVQDGHDVAAVASGAEAFTVLSADHKFDLVLLDVLMPDMNGIEILTRLKTDERLYQIPVIMISGLQETEAVLRCIKAGADDYLPKPCDVVLLRARINSCLERKRWRLREHEYLTRLKDEKAKSDALLRNILPEPVVFRLNDGETIIADRYEAVSILFADIVGFTPAAAAMSPASLVVSLNRVFTEFDNLALRLGVEKIKTIGDAYMAAAGLPEPRLDHVEAIVAFGTGILDLLRSMFGPDEPVMRVRIGIHTGSVVAGVIGRHKFSYDVWGDTVNMASRLETHGMPDRIQVSQEVRDALAHRFQFEERGPIMLKGKGMTPTFFLIPD
jgi:adenylate cyclase